jgi:hypothetical protein
MSIFSLNWFKSKKRTEIESLEEKIDSLKNQVNNMNSTTPPVKEEVVAKHYRKVKLVNNVLTVVFNDGSVISKPNATVEDFTNVRNSTSEKQIMAIVATEEIYEQRKKEIHEAQRATALRNGIQILANLDDFVLDGNSVYLKGINRTLPQLLVEEFVGIVDGYIPGEHLQDVLNEDEQYQSLKRFFMWCCLNPRAEVADKLYTFLRKNSFRITKQGFFVALRNVVTVSEDTELVQFVSNAYNKVKAVWKKNPSHFRVVEIGGEYSIQKLITPLQGTFIGNLDELYTDMPNMEGNRFTDAHTRTFDIRVGKPVNMNPGECRWNTDDCGAEGLHFTADEIHYVGCGDQSVLVLINPMKVVGIGESKGRCWEYLPIMTVPREEATEILHDLDFDTMQLDESYAIRELEGLAEKAKDGFVYESTKHEFNLPHISTVEIENIVSSLDKMKSEISSRVQMIAD